MKFWDKQCMYVHALTFCLPKSFAGAPYEHFKEHHKKRNENWERSPNLRVMALIFYEQKTKTSIGRFPLSSDSNRVKDEPVLESSRNFQITM